MLRMLICELISVNFRNQAVLKNQATLFRNQDAYKINQKNRINKM